MEKMPEPFGVTAHRKLKSAKPQERLMTKKQKPYKVLNRKDGTTEEFKELKDAERSKRGDPYKIYVDGPHKK
jgi:hypothetical protein